MIHSDVELFFDRNIFWILGRQVRAERDAVKGNRLCKVDNFCCPNFILQPCSALISCFCCSEEDAIDQITARERTRLNSSPRPYGAMDKRSKRLVPVDALPREPSHRADSSILFATPPSSPRFSERHPEFAKIHPLRIQIGMEKFTSFNTATDPRGESWMVDCINGSLNLAMRFDQGEAVTVDEYATFYEHVFQIFTSERLGYMCEKLALSNMKEHLGNLRGNVDKYGPLLANHFTAEVRNKIEFRRWQFKSIKNSKLFMIVCSKPSKWYQFRSTINNIIYLFF